ncbi:glucose-1-phosphate adenylyltransferase subunit GlgD [Mycoplasmopsis agassizii]|uniref:Glucose-1-phosphate adenylyltransferase subunit GlgD n=1 Tax=Mycoplasmopsis agassizii TaxID=33922 RepID=A0A269TKE6_9BACT|nr:glucose-1-phosphate adenylyltransferase subunit GlgD [Mycoplasmopsis agassizii]PAK21630.1 glucose-1-phosphate adenylyltransferase subunit GlgD [Mycoplasmopsis agassizii]
MSLHKNVIAIVDANENASRIRGLGVSHAKPIMPVLARYNLVDFAFSNLIYAGIYPVFLLVDKPNRHIFNYIGTGSPWNLNRRSNGIHYLFSTKEQIGTGNNLGALYKTVSFVKSIDRDVVLLTNTNTINRIDYVEMYEKLKTSGADIVWAFRREANHDRYLNMEILKFNARTEKVVNFGINTGSKEEIKIDLGIFMMSKKMYLSLISEAVELNINSKFETFLKSKVEELKIIAYEIDTWVGFLNSAEEYFENQLKLMNDQNIAVETFTKFPLYTRELDQTSSYYSQSASVSNSLLASGCKIKGKVKNSILFRGVEIGKNAEVEDSIILSNVIIGDNVKLKNIIIDENAIISSEKTLIADKKSPLVIMKNSKI